MTRRLSNWLESFVEYSQVFNTPDRYRRWAGLWTLGVAAKRSIAMKSRGQILPPNLYLELVGGPSTGKSQAVEAVKSVLSPATKFAYIPPSVTRAGLEDFMVGNMHTRKDPSGRLMASNECIALCEEMQGILPDQDLGHLTLYNTLYDPRPTYKAVTRTHGEIRLEAPYCAILTGAQPAFLATTLPEGAWGMGFMSRSIMIWGTPPERRSMFEDGEMDYKLQADLVADLKEIFDAYGWMKWTTPAQRLYDQWWVKAGGMPIPKHKRLAMGYNGRREINMAKLAMIFSLSESTNLIVDEAHVASAIRTLLEAETQMQYIFNEMSSTGSMVAMEDVIDQVRNHSAEGRDTAEADIIYMLMQRFPSTQVHSMIENMISAGTLEISGGNAVRGIRKFRIGKKIAVV